MNYNEWLEDIPSAFTDDALWRMEVYRLSLFASDVCWRDLRKLHSSRHTRSLADQLYRAVGSIGANIAEGYSRRSKKDQARFYEYALGSARESRDWYFKGRFALGEEVVEHRLVFMTEIIRLLLTIIPRNRDGRVRETDARYATHRLPDPASNLTDLLRSLPFAD
jgi:four helix bundle protein